VDLNSGIGWMPQTGPQTGGPSQMPGGSNRLDQGTLSYALASIPLADAKVEIRVSPVDQGLDTPVRPFIDMSLPMKAQGNGIPIGDGKGFGRGHGDNFGNGNGGGAGAPSLDRQAIIEKLKLKKSVQPSWSDKPGESPEDGDIVRVRVTLDASGIPTEAVPISGKKDLCPVVLEAAKKWRFVVPDGFEEFAPFSVVIAFTYRLSDKPSSQVQELSPVILSRPS